MHAARADARRAGHRSDSKAGRLARSTAESEARYRGLLEAAPDAMVVVNGAGEIVLLNLQAEKQFGYHRDELVGQQVTNIIPTGFAERIIADDLRSAADALAQQIGTGIELVALRKDGTQFPIELMLSPLEGSEGILVTAAIRDISVRKAAEEEMRRTSSYLENLIDYANAPIIVWDPDLRITRFNHAFERLTQRQDAEVVGQKLDLLFPDGSREPSLARVALAGHGKSLEGDDIPILRADGVVRSVLWSSANIYDTAGGGTLLAVIAQGQDITESNESEGRYRGLLEAAPDAMVVVNGAGEIVLLNLQAEKQFGYHRDELVGQQVTNIIPTGFAERIIADDLRSAADALAQQIGTGIELVALRKDGTQFPIELMLSPLEGSEGILVTAAIRDISVRKAAESHLAQMEGRYRGLLEAAPDAMVVVNGAGEIVLLNLQAEKQFGYHRDELVGQQVTNIIPTGFAERIIADDLRSAADALAQQIGTGIELVALRKDGTQFPIELMLSPLEGSEGILVTAAIRDISVRKAAAVALLQSELWYRTLADSLPHLVWTCRADGPCDYLSPRWVEYTGVSESDQLGYRWLEQLHPDDRDRVIAEWTEAAARGDSFDIEFRIRRADGAFRWFKTRAIPLRDSDGRLVKWFGSNSDIDDSKRARVHLEEAQRVAHLGSWDWDPVADEISGSEEFFRLFDALPEEILRYAQFAEHLHSDDREHVDRDVADALAANRPYDTEYRVRLRDGGWRDINARGHVVTGADGQPLRFVGTCLDITERKAAEEELSRTAAFLENLIGYANVPIIVWRPDQRITQFNRAFERLSQRSSLEVVGQALDVLFPSGSRDSSLVRLRLAAEGESLESVEIPILRADGAVRAVLWNSANIYDTAAGGGLLAVIAQGQDITERQAAEEELSRKTQELMRSNEELGQFAYIASHDLQEPLRMVASYTQLLSRRYKGRLDADADEFIAFAVDGASRMQRLIEDLLAYSRVGTRGMDLVCTSSERAFGQALVNLRGSIDESGAKATHDPLPEVLADEVQLVQLFQNLVGNAIKYRRAGVPRVHVSVVRNVDGNWRFAVKDNGIGIDPQYFERIFGMFQRLHKRDEFAGTGIGLAICRKIVERHGGTISVESKPGHGSTFHFTLAGNGAQP